MRAGSLKAKVLILSTLQSQILFSSSLRIQIKKKLKQKEIYTTNSIMYVPSFLSDSSLESSKTQQIRNLSTKNLICQPNSPLLRIHILTPQNQNLDSRFPLKKKTERVILVVIMKMTRLEIHLSLLDVMTTKPKGKPDNRSQFICCMDLY
jgi:hypothetical protein